MKTESDSSHIIRGWVLAPKVETQVICTYDATLRVMAQGEAEIMLPITSLLGWVLCKTRRRNSGLCHMMVFTFEDWHHLRPCVFLWLEHDLVFSPHHQRLRPPSGGPSTDRHSSLNRGVPKTEPVLQGRADHYTVQWDGASCEISILARFTRAVQVEVILNLHLEDYCSRPPGLWM